MPERLAIIGASGFVGSALTEYALDHGDMAVTPFCHSTGGASRLAHRGLEIRQLDLLDRGGVYSALRGFDYIVNASRGGKQVMLTGLANLLEASRKVSAKKFVHLSSVAVYGDPPPPASTSEDAPAAPAPGSYGAMKLAQDVLVQRAAAGDLDAVILCPPNIIGPYSDYLTDIIHSIEVGRFRLMDGGRHCVNVVDVNNLSACVLCALASGVGDGRRLFVCEPAGITWLQLCEELAPVVRGSSAIPSISADALNIVAAPTGNATARKGRYHGALKHLMADEVREALRMHPAWASLERKAKAGVRALGKGTESRLRSTFSGPIKVAKRWPEEAVDRALIAQQLRDVKHDPSRCHHELAFEPPLSFAQSMQSFRDWYARFFAAGSAEWQLLGRQWPRASDTIR